jgi:hypothetical protein
MLPTWFKGSPVPPAAFCAIIFGAVEQKTGLLVVLLIPALAIAYYFAIALSQNQKEHLAFEKQNYADEKKRKPEEEEKRTTDETLLKDCLDTADTAYWSYIKLNGRLDPAKPDTCSVHVSVWDTAQTEQMRKPNRLPAVLTPDEVEASSSFIPVSVDKS